MPCHTTNTWLERTGQLCRSKYYGNIYCQTVLTPMLGIWEGALFHGSRLERQEKRPTVNRGTPLQELHYHCVFVNAVLVVGIRIQLP